MTVKARAPRMEVGTMVAAVVQPAVTALVAAILFGFAEVVTLVMVLALA